MTRPVLFLLLLCLSMEPAHLTARNTAGAPPGELKIVRTTVGTDAQTPPDTLSNPDPSPEAVALFRYLCDMSGKKILSGQMWAPWGVDELNYLQQVTGKLPAVRGADLITESSNTAEIQNEINWWNRGGIPTIMWHWGAPGVGEGYENSKVEIDIDKCFQAGTAEYTDFWRELKLKADHLQVLRDAHVPVLWRPFHELNGNWFWWGKKGPEQFKRLWRTMYEYFVNDRGLNNLIWVLCYTGSPEAAWYPGDEYVDIAGADTYDGGQDVHAGMYNTVRNITGSETLPVAYHECGVPPNPDQCLKQGVMWSWWMIWHTTWLTGNDQDYLNYVFNHDLVITLDEMPDIMAVYGWDHSCTPATVTAQLRVDDGELQQGNTIFVDSGTSVTFKPTADMDGSWAWSGCGLSGSAEEQTTGTGNSCISSAIFTNTCGAVTTQTFNIAGNCEPYKVTPHARIDGGDWKQTTLINVKFGSVIVLAPEASDTGTWNWSGCGTSGTSRIQSIIPSEPCKAVVRFTNNCGETGTSTYTISPCPVPVISPIVQVFGGIWELKTEVYVGAGLEVILSPQPATGGTWEWSGCGLSGSARTQSVRPDSSCTATVNYTNDCGEENSLDFHINVYSTDSTDAVKTPTQPTLALFPDPCRDILYLNPGSFQVHSGLFVTIYTISGVPAMQTIIRNSDLSVDVSALKPDFYIIKISSDGQEFTDRFLKAN